MTWDGSGRRDRLPANWPTIRAAVLHRDHNTCQLRGRRCTVIATDVDHVIPGDDHSMSNLQAACGPCHREKSAREGGTAASRRAALGRAPAERHPGLKG